MAEMWLARTSSYIEKHVLLSTTKVGFVLTLSHYESKVPGPGLSAEYWVVPILPESNKKGGLRVGKL